MMDKTEDASVERCQKLEDELSRSRDFNARLLDAQDNLVEKLEKAEAQCRDLKLRKDESVRRRQEESAKLKALSRKYNALANSKLGRATLRWWRLKEALKARISKAGSGVPGHAASLRPHPPGSTTFNPATCKMAERLRRASAGKKLDYRAVGDFLKGTKVACIMDEFTWKSYSPEANMIQLVPEDYGNQLNEFQPELIFIESAWRGVDDKWTNSVSKMPDELKGILKWARDNGVPTAFWNKEDPIHFDTFKAVAALFDFIFTYDFDCVQKYRQLTGRDNAFFLPMAVQPAMFNPLEKYERKDAFCFAGSYYRRYVERARDFDGYVREFPKYKELVIYDRQAGQDNPNYMMPPEYTPYIKGHLPYDQIDKSYKGYTVSINLNSIKQANSIARRVFELLACNTVTVSNFSHGVVTGFGDLVITSDSADVILDKLRRYESRPRDIEKFKLLGLRKVFSDSTYRDRFAYVCSKVLGIDLASVSPRVAIVARVRNEGECRRVKASFDRQAYGARELLVLADGLDFARDAIRDADELLRRLAGFDYVGVMSPDDYYAEHYLDDLVCAFKYAPTDAVVKGSYFEADGGATAVKTEARPYVTTAKACLRRGLVKAGAFAADAAENAKRICDGNPKVEVRALSIDMFNYCANGTELNESQVNEVSDLAGIDTGFDFAEMQDQAEGLKTVFQAPEDGPTIPASKLFVRAAKVDGITASLADGKLVLTSDLGKGENAYYPLGRRIAVNKLPVKDGQLHLHLHTDYYSSVLLNVAYFFYDENKRKISSAVGAANANLSAEIPDGTSFVTFKLRLKGSGTAGVVALNLFHKPTPFPYCLDRNEVLCIANHYPAYDDIYRNGFVHSRIKLYAQHGANVSVFSFGSNAQVLFSEFEGVNVVSGNGDYLRFMLGNHRYSTIVVHFLSEPMWEVLRELPETTRIVVWCHGAEVLKYRRRLFNLEGKPISESVIRQSYQRGVFWRELLGNPPRNLHFVFVSEWLKSIVEADYGVALPPDRCSIINNPIDTDVFEYRRKDPSQRYKILSIRPFASRVYANDVTVKCIMELSKRRDFDKFEFMIVGNGPLFDETLAPLSGFSNVRIRQGFLRRNEIAAYHRQYGIFLVPSRQDTQGVSRDEAMASGLVPITNKVAAIPEFVDESCGVLSPDEDYADMARQIGRIVDDPNLFLSMSKAAAERVRRTTSGDVIAEKELSLILGN